MAIIKDRAAAEAVASAKTNRETHRQKTFGHYYRFVHALSRGSCDQRIPVTNDSGQITLDTSRPPLTVQEAWV